MEMGAKAAAFLLLVMGSLIEESMQQNAPDNRGTLFIIGFGENSGKSLATELFVTTPRTTTVNVVVTAPLYSSTLRYTFSVTAGTVKQLQMDTNLRMFGTVKAYKGIQVSADNEVVVYGVNKEYYSCDAYLALPVDVLGMEYYTVSWFPSSYKCQIVVFGVEDRTSVTITLSEHMGSQYVTWDGKNYYAGQTIRTTLNKYEVWQIQTPGDLTGSKIAANKKVGVLGGNQRTNIGIGTSSDHIVEMLTPVDTWGKNFITVPIPLRTTGDYFKFIASEDNTRVTISGGYSSVFTIARKGTFVQRTIPSGRYNKVVADKPISVFQFCMSEQSSTEESDPMLMLIPPMEQFGADYTFSTPKYSYGSYNSYFMFVVKTGEKSGLRHNGNPFPSTTTYNSIAGTDYVAGFIRIPEGSHVIRHTSPISIFGGYLYGQAKFETYGFPTGMRMAPVNTVCVPTATVVGDGLDNDCDGKIDEELCTPENQGKDDDGDGKAEEDCATPPPVDGGWANWGSFGSCSISCKTYGGTTSGTYTKTRTCTNPTPKYDGKQCVGSATYSASCTPASYCPINGNWGSWGAYGGCSVTCETGTMTRSRSCNNPAPNYGGAACSGSSTSSTTCTLPACPIDGEWASWSTWGTCSLTCGGGSQGRSRTCTNPAPQHGGANCVGAASETQTCNTQLCIIDGAWGVWGAWGACSVSCGGGQYSRARTCSDPYPANGGLPCSGDSSEFGNCSTQTCPTAAPGGYVQLCPAGWFTCQSGTVSCIDAAFVCDCGADCDDGSDETSGYATCDAQLLAQCPSSAHGAKAAAFLLLVCGSLIKESMLQNAPDNRGTLFIIGFGENSGKSLNTELFITTPRTTNVNVVVTAPMYSSTLRYTFSVTAGTVKQLKMDNNLRMFGTVKSYKGIQVSADNEVIVYGVNKEYYSCDAYLALPVDVLGMEYYTVSWYPSSYRCQIVVFGVEDRTSVTVTLSEHLGSRYVTWSGKNYYAGQTIRTTLNKYEVWQIQTYGDLTGSKIVANKKVGVLGGNQRTNIGSGGSSDHIVEMLTPVDTWGKNFITVPIPLRTTGDYFKFIASEDNTRVTISGGYSSSFTISRKGTFVQRTIPSGRYNKVVADKPISVFQFCMSQQSSAEESDPMLMLIPPMEQYGADYTFSTPKYSYGSYSSYFMFVVKKGEKSGLRHNGNPFPSTTSYHSISGTDYVAGFIRIPEGSHVIRHTSPISIFGGYLYGQAKYETYGFPTGMRMAPVNTVCVPTPTVVGDGLDNDCDGKIDEELCTPENQGKDDDGDGKTEEDCATPPPIDGGWANWGSFGSCSISCKTYGGTTSGTYTKTRTCTNPTPKYDGKQCAGSATYSASCTPASYCPINGNWGSWGAYGSCSVTCETGTKTRSRSCNNPAPNYGGSACSGSSTSSTTCTLPACPIDGEWASWSTWGTCTVTCGGGSQGRSRTCTNPAPQYGGANCVGAASETQTCNTQVCIIDGAWATWGAWGACSVSCGGGQYSRARTCSDPYPANGGLPCSGDSSEYGNCSTQACPTAAPGAYVQLCPAGWFTCQFGTVSCIDAAFVCDCDADCADGSDETSGYATCDAQLLAQCPSSAHAMTSFPVIVLVALSATLTAWFFQRS